MPKNDEILTAAELGRAGTSGIVEQTIRALAAALEHAQECSSTVDGTECESCDAGYELIRQYKGEA